MNNESIALNVLIALNNNDDKKISHYYNDY